MIRLCIWMGRISMNVRLKGKSSVSSLRSWVSIHVFDKKSVK